MFITIRTGKKLLGRKVKVCDTVFSRTLGLMFHPRLNSEEGMLLVAKKESIVQTSIHSFFVFFPFDVVWLNENKEIVEKRTVKPFQAFIAPKVPAKYVLELPEGTTKWIELETSLQW